MNATLEAPETESGLSIPVGDLDPARHDATLTLVSPRTGDHRTLRIETMRRGKLQGRRTVSLLTAPETYHAFAFVGDDGRTHVWRTRRGADREHPSQFERLADLIDRRRYWSGRGVEYLISLQCRRCGRPLTHPSSLISGIGPICATR